MKNETQLSTHAPDLESELDTPRGLTPQERLISFLESTLASIHYELVSIEIINQRQKTLRIFIDKLYKASSDGMCAGVGIEDCVEVTHFLDSPLEQNKDVEAIFKGPYELEVSSPGIDRPLRKPQDYTRFAAQIARIHTLRPLTALEAQAETYCAKNPKQKNFYGILRGFEAPAVLFGVVPEDGTLKSQKGKKRIDTTLPLKNETLIRIPLGLISKANLEPVLENE